MEFSFKKYISMILFVIICVAIIIPLLNPSLSAENQSSNLPPPMEEVPEETPDSDAEDEITENVPVFKNAFDAHAYANNILRNGKGYHTVSYSTQDATVFGIKQTQYLYTESMRSGEEKYEYTIATCDINIGENSYRWQYQEKNGGQVTRRITQNINKSGAASIKDVAPIWDGVEIKTYDYNDYIQNVSSVGFNFLCYDFTPETAKVDYFKIEGNYYVFSFTMNVDKMRPEYVRNFELGAGATQIKFNSSTIKFVMNRKTGKFVSATKQENYNMTARGVSLKIDATTNYSFKKQDETFDIIKP